MSQLGAWDSRQIKQMAPSSKGKGGKDDVKRPLMERAFTREESEFTAVMNVFPVL